MLLVYRQYIYILIEKSKIFFDMRSWPCWFLKVYQVAKVRYPAPHISLSVAAGGRYEFSFYYSHGLIARGHIKNIYLKFFLDSIYVRHRTSTCGISVGIHTHKIVYY